MVASSRPAFAQGIRAAYSTRRSDGGILVLIGDGLRLPGVKDMLQRAGALGDVVLRRPDQLDELAACGLAALGTTLDGRATKLVTDLDALYAAEELAPGSTALLIAWEPPRGCVGGRRASTVVSGAAAGPIPHDLATVALADLVSAGHPPRTAAASAPVRARRSSRPARRPRRVSARRACGRGSGCGS